MWMGYKLSYNTLKGGKSRIIKGPNLKSTINFKTKMLFILSWTDISHVSKSQENFTLHKPFYSFINNSVLKYNYRFHSDTWVSLKHILKATATTKRSEAIFSSHYNDYKSLAFNCYPIQTSHFFRVLCKILAPYWIILLFNIKLSKKKKTN